MKHRENRQMVLNLPLSDLAKLLDGGHRLLVRQWHGPQDNRVIEYSRMPDDCEIVGVVHNEHSCAMLSLTVWSRKFDLLMPGNYLPYLISAVIVPAAEVPSDLSEFVAE